MVEVAANRGRPRSASGPRWRSARIELIITRLKVNAFIATLGTALVMRGLLNASFENFSGAVPPEFQALGYDSIGPVPWSILLLLGLAGAAWALVRYTRFGYHLYAVG